MTFEPSIGELAAREQELRKDLIEKGLLPNTNGLVGAPRGSFGRPPGSTPTPQSFNKPSANVAAALLDPEGAEILFINIVSGRVVTTLGEFPLNEIEMAQLAFVGLNCLTRNLQAVVSSLETKYRIPDLKEHAALAQKQMLEQQKITKAQDELLASQSNANSDGDAASEFAPLDDEIDEENDLPPIPLNRRRPRGRPRKN